MKPSQNIEKIVKRLHFTAGPEMDGRIWSHVLKAREELKKKKAAKLEPPIWRTIMKSRITKLAAAAVIAVAVLVGIGHFGGSFDGSGIAYGMNDVPRLFNEARIVHTQGWLYFNLTDNGRKVPREPLERWIDRENGRARSSTIRVSCTPEKVEIDRMETVSDGHYRMILNHTDKSAIFYKLSDYQRMLQIHYSLKDMFNGLFGNIETFDKFERTGQVNRDGVTYEIWEAEVRDQAGVRNGYKYWLSPLTGQSGRFQYWYKNPGEPWRLGHDFYKIERNVDIPEGVFELVVPEGYEAKNTQETAIPLEVDEEGAIGKCGLILDPHISFALSDGSVILAWCSVDRDSAIPQEKLFEGLEFGGPLPKLPAEIYRLKPRGWTAEIVYIGRHLTHTQKGEKFVEWSLYVPSGVPPVHSQMLDYEAVCRYNLESQEDGVLEDTMNQSVPGVPGAGLPPSARNQMLRDKGLEITVNQGIPINSSEDFDKWVLGAMVELSDDGSVPERMTYESVLELADDIRQSITD